MASLRKKGKYYYARFYDGDRSPKQKEVALRRTHKEAARRKMKRLERRWERGSYDPWTDKDPDRVDLAEAIQRFLDVKRGQNRSERTVETYEGILTRWGETLPAGFMADSIRPDHIRPYVHDEDVTGSTRHKRYRHIKAFLNWAGENGLVPEEPMERVEKPQKGETVPAYLTPDQLERLLEYIDWHADNVENVAGESADVQWLRDAIVIALATGLRRGELLNLRWADVDLTEKRLHVRNRDGFQTKSGSERVVPLRGPALEVVRRMEEEREYREDQPVLIDGRGKHVLPDRLTHRFKDMVRGAKLQNRERLSFHSLRHSCGAWLASQGVSARIIQEILGHASTQTTQIYSHIASNAMEEAMEKAFGGSD